MLDVSSVFPATASCSSKARQPWAVKTRDNMMIRTAAWLLTVPDAPSHRPARPGSSPLDGSRTSESKPETRLCAASNAVPDLLADAWQQAKWRRLTLQHGAWQSRLEVHPELGVDRSSDDVVLACVISNEAAVAEVRKAIEQIGGTDVQTRARQNRSVLEDAAQ